MKLTVNRKDASEKSKAELRGEYNSQFINDKMVISGYYSLSEYEKEFVAEEISKKLSKETKLVSDLDILNHCKEQKALYFKNKCEDVIVEGFTASNGHFYRTNRDDQTNMIGQKDELTADETILSVPWKTEDSGYLMHSRDEWLAIYTEAFNHKKNTLFKYDNLKKKVFDVSVTTHELLDAIKW